jgi:hypothetical protein
MSSVRAVIFLVATAIAVAMAVSFSPTANAQTMGEYGATVGNAAGAAGSVPSISPPDLSGSFQTSSGNAGSPGGSQTIEIRGGRSDYAAPSTARSQAHDKDRNFDNSTDDWVQVR